MPLGSFKLNSLSAAVQSALGPLLGAWGLTTVIDNPNAYLLRSADNFGISVATTDTLTIVGANQEDDNGVNQSGKAYIFDSVSGELLYTLDNPNAYSTSSTDNFGWKVSISNNYAIVSANQEDDASGNTSGKAYIYKLSTLPTAPATITSADYVLDNPNAYGTSDSDNFGYTLDISDTYAIVGAYQEDDSSETFATNSGKAYIYKLSTLPTAPATITSADYVLDDPNNYGTFDSDFFGVSLAITNTYAIVGAHLEDDAGGTQSGAAYLYKLSTLPTAPATITSADYVLTNPNAYSTSLGDAFGYSVDISDTYAIAGAYGEDSNGTGSGAAYLYKLSTLPTAPATITSADYVLADANAYSTGNNDQYGQTVSVGNNYAVVASLVEDNAEDGSSVGKAYVYDLSTLPTAPATITSADYVLDNPSIFATASLDNFGNAIDISDNNIVIGANFEGDEGGSASGRVYKYTRVEESHISPNKNGFIFMASVNSSASTIAIPSTARLGDVAVLVDLSTSVTNTTPSGWTQITGVTTTGIRQNISYRVVTASGTGSPGSTVTGMSGTTRKIMLIFRDYSTNSPVVVWTKPSGQATTVAPSNQTINGNFYPDHSVMIAAYGKTTTTVPTQGWISSPSTTPVTLSLAGGPGIYVKHLAYSAGKYGLEQPNVTVSMSDAGTNALQTFRLRSVKAATNDLYIVETQVLDGYFGMVWPTVKAGDIAVHFGIANGSTLPTGVVSLGSATQISAGTSGTTRYNITQRVCNGSETGNITNMTADNYTVSALIILRKNGTVPTVATKNSTNAEISSSTLADQTLAMSSIGQPFIGFALYGCNGTLATANSSETPTNTISWASVPHQIKLFESNLATFADSTISMPNQGDPNYMVSFAITSN